MRCKHTEYRKAPFTMLRSCFFIAIVCTVMYLGCAPQNVETLPDPLVNNRDSSVTPGQDFFLHANGGWFKRNPIPESESSNGLWLTIGEETRTAVREICEKSAQETKAPKGSNKQKIGDFYASGMDSAASEKAGITPLKSELDRIDAMKSISELAAVAARLHQINGDPIFSFNIYKDDKKPTEYAVALNQGGLGLPDRDYYFKNDERTTGIREAYQKHLFRNFEIIGESPDQARAFADHIFALEKTLAKASRTLEGLRDPYANYNKMSVAELSKLTPSFDWNVFFQNTGLKNVDSVIVGQPEFFKEVENAVKNTSLDAWKAYLRWSVIGTYAAYLNQALVDENFNFYSKTLYGVKQMKPRWKRVVERTNRALGEVIGQVYVEEYLPKGTKEKLLEIGNNIRDVCRERIEKVSWMSDATRERALLKLQTMAMKVGHPDQWRDYSRLSVERDTYVANVMRANVYEFDFMIGKYGKPVDRTEWNITPQTYNAYYDPTNNEIVVPAANIIVPGFGKTMPDDAILYGIIGGSTFGHEIIHGFDDQGSQYDETGKLNNWWTKEDRARFEAKTKMLVTQFNNYVVLDSMHLRGEATLGENIADLGGVELGYDAFKRSAQYKNNQKVAGLTPDQRYFLAYAYAWMIQMRPEMLASRIMSDVHAPAQHRVIGPLSNNVKFYEVFGIKPGDAMYRPENERVSIW